MRNIEKSEYDVTVTSSLGVASQNWVWGFFVRRLSLCVNFMTLALLVPEIPCHIKQGFWYFAGKKAKFCGIFRGKFAEKSADFAGFSRGKQVEIRKKIGRFRGRKVKIRRKIGQFRGGLAAKSQISKDFQGQIRGKIGRFHGKFRRETSPRNNQ